MTISLTQEEYEQDLDEARREGYNEAVEDCTAYAVKLIGKEWFDMSELSTLRRDGDERG